MQQQYLQLLAAAGADAAAIKELQALAEGCPVQEEGRRDKQQPVLPTPGDVEALIARHTALKLIVPAVKYLEVCTLTDWQLKGLLLLVLPS